MAENEFSEEPQPHGGQDQAPDERTPADGRTDPPPAVTAQYPPPPLVAGSYGGTAGYPSGYAGGTSPYGTSPYGASPYGGYAGAEPAYQAPSSGTGYPYGYPAAGADTAAVAAGGRPVDERRGRSGVGLPLLITALVAALVGGGVGAVTVAVADRHADTVNTGLKITNSTAGPAAPTNGTIGAAAARIRPSVVTINEVSGTSGGTGSGVIIRDDGYILTNDHVISLAAQGGSLRVTLSDGRTAKATIVGRDTSDDLAVIKVSGLSKLTAAAFGKSSTLSVGQTVVAVGAPLGLSDTVTSGIVSNTARPVRAGDNDQAVFQAIQTDAAINPGNSGGPLVDLNGSVMGINAAIATDSSGGGLQIPGQTQQSGNIGIGFAIPSDEASRIASELIANGKAYHAVLGISVRSTSTSSAAGVQIAGVTAGSGAARAGLKVGDVVTAINAHAVTTADSLIAAVRSYAPGLKVSITYSRGAATSSATITLDRSDK
ncbi:trypsin-like peptidase domain-containing protein [Jatrophihabitans telluris]|uniref:Trypsin-like peptidase domain-containing protein n=1 Tax=Jatrophihabitans telluris TaxID=2038343 RepID=A0ABY4R0C3_9ACTN|nr:trypsin-like peptidase domain-containing protein [Jatrophihabitans telluris]UQX88605.1 trypsin-like peptidase domain-containing protein [Jatrophihabitans telluris]